MSVLTELTKQQALSDWVDETFKKGFRTDAKNSNLALGCFDLAIEHHASIVILCDLMLYGSALALYRTLLDSLVRGQFFLYCATDENIEKFERGDMGIKIGPMIQAIETSMGITDGAIATLKKNSYSLMCDFTHTGHQHLLRRAKAGTVGYQNYSDEEKTTLLASAGTLLLFAAASLAEMTRDNTIKAKVLEQVERYAAP